MKGALTGAEERPFSPLSGSWRRSVALRLVARLNLLRGNRDSGTLCMKASISRRRAHSPSRGALSLKLRQAGRTLPLPLQLPLRGGRGGERQSCRAVLHGKRSFSNHVADLG